jgi:hypothetical protein
MANKTAGGNAAVSLNLPGNTVYRVFTNNTLQSSFTSEQPWQRFHVERVLITLPESSFNNDFSHIEDPNERRRLALAEIDKAPFGWYHVRAILVAGTGFFTDSYDIFCVSLLTIMLGIVYKHDNKGALTTQQDTAIKLATSAGTVLGQVGFGALADIVGRKKMYGLELILIIVATLAQSLVGPGPGTSVVGLIIFWRVLMGIGELCYPDFIRSLR